MKLKMTLSASVVLCGPAMAQDVYPGCDVPTSVANHHTYYVDPVKGTDGGDGSALRPWKSLNTILAPANRFLATKSHKTISGSPLLDVNPTAPIKGGDTVMLASGNYGDIAVANAFNDKFITIMPAPGARPVIAHLKVSGASRWLFQGITFQAENPAGSKPSVSTLVNVADGWGDVSSNVIFNTSTFQTANDSSNWSDQDWYIRPNSTALAIGSKCVAVTASTFKNLTNGIATNATQTLIKNNTIDRFSADAIDIIAGQASVVGNTITNSMYNTTSGIHPDAIQAWSPTIKGKMVLSSDILIDSNKVYTPKGNNGNALQGISAGSCDKVVFRNNVVVVNHWNGLTANALTNSVIINNTVLSSDPVGHPAYITIKPNAVGASDNVIVRNNISSYINILDEGVVFDHNVASGAYNIRQGSKSIWMSKNDTVLQNLVVPTLNNSFRNWDPSKNNFDVHLKPSSAIAGLGSPILATTLDADGRPRTKPIDMGAFTR